MFTVSHSLIIVIPWLLVLLLQPSFTELKRRSTSPLAELGMVLVIIELNSSISVSRWTV
jgi:hypothetical protein